MWLSLFDITEKHYAIIREPHSEIMKAHILTINAGSSSIKFALFTNDNALSRFHHGRIERIGLPDCTFTSVDADGKEVTRVLGEVDMRSATQTLEEFLNSMVDFENVSVIGHRIVHGMERKVHEEVTPALIAALKDIAPLDPEHLPAEIAIIEMFAARHSGIMQVACFDTVFHQSMPRVAQIIPLPRRYALMGIHRYGFHGLSCASIMETLRTDLPERAHGRVIILHLGSGASVTAVKAGVSIDTSMGFTPASGIPMSTRGGEIDAGALLHVMKTEKHTADEMTHMINHESGLLGISEVSADMYDLLSAEETEPRAKEAVDYFCYEVKKRIGAYASALGGIDVLVFAGGMGERAPRIRARICEGLEFLGIALDSELNQQNAESIGSASAGVATLVIHTDEEQTIAHIAQGFIDK